MSEAIRLAWDLISPGWDMVWVGRLGINEAGFSELQDACMQLLRRAHLLRM
jgi:RNase P protein component